MYFAWMNEVGFFFSPETVMFALKIKIKIMYCLLCWLHSNVVPAKETQQLSKAKMICWIALNKGIDRHILFMCISFYNSDKLSPHLGNLKLPSTQRKRSDKM